MTDAVYGKQIVVRAYSREGLKCGDIGGRQFYSLVNFITPAFKIVFLAILFQKIVPVILGAANIASIIQCANLAHSLSKVF